MDGIEMMNRELSKILAIPFNLPLAIGNALIEVTNDVQGSNPFEITAKTIEKAMSTLPIPMAPPVPFMGSAERLVPEGKKPRKYYSTIF